MPSGETHPYHMLYSYNALSPYYAQYWTNGKDVNPNPSVSSRGSYYYPEMTLGKENYVPAQNLESKYYKPYSREGLNCAIQAVVSRHMSVSQASKKYNVPYSTLSYNIKKFSIETFSKCSCKKCAN
ncbi:uncharacterized protein LOC123677950 isoform X3 [Harmonia axyridis]|uniref:uncharacterized protein LOC123677950 isoform X3 n=1 Tax=Harmonia axyridis TaxID=115357 RepID=UPI001E27590B|nr:uncharacterized protein LOC123677950 isoform X3 [Harmonia axyridis]XP_045470650.1 uncharacterized protein LOC123677950 isoform X3 [Harmonia axyridis]XP_045470652.1 uncharacterized protein LOC123677950 isoform X3 [Harmonia axyridis]